MSNNWGQQFVMVTCMKNPNFFTVAIANVLFPLAVVMLRDAGCVITACKVLFTLGNLW